MSKGKRDALILSLIGIILYSLAYYNFVLVDALSEFDDINSKIESAEMRKAALDEDLKNLATLQRNLEIKTVQNERLEEYLMSVSNISDNIDYIDKLAKLFTNSFTTIKVGVPKENTSKSTSTKYYEFAIDVTGKMTYSNAMNLVDYIEGGTRKVKIVLFHLTPLGPSIQNAQEPQNAVATADGDFSLKMQINLYSLNLSDIDKVYEYSRKRFNNFDEGDGVIFVPDSTTTSSVGTTTGSSGSGPIKNVITNGNDIDIQLGSFLLARQNFVITAIGNQYPIKLKPKERTEVKITFNGNNYYLSVLDNAGKAYNLNGLTKNDSIKMYVGVDFPLDIVENQNLGTDIQIINNSGKRVDLNLNDKVKRVKIKDRNGNVIVNRSEIEKVYII